MRRKGLPGDLERETYDAVRSIFLKYLSMKKKHMSRWRIGGIMLDAANRARSDVPNQFSTTETKVASWPICKP